MLPPPNLLRSLREYRGEEANLSWLEDKLERLRSRHERYKESLDDLSRNQCPDEPSLLSQVWGCIKRDGQKWETAVPNKDHKTFDNECLAGFPKRSEAVRIAGKAYSEAASNARKLQAMPPSWTQTSRFWGPRLCASIKTSRWLPVT